jgi:hypothetical protein
MVMIGRFSTNGATTPTTGVGIAAALVVILGFGAVFWWLLAGTSGDRAPVGVVLQVPRGSEVAWEGRRLALSPLLNPDNTQATTDVYRIGLPPGSLTVTVRQPGRAAIPYTVTVNPGDQAPLFTIANDTITRVTP